MAKLRCALKLAIYDGDIMFSLSSRIKEKLTKGMIDLLLPTACLYHFYVSHVAKRVAFSSKYGSSGVCMKDCQRSLSQMAEYIKVCQETEKQTERFAGEGKRQENTYRQLG